MTVPLLAVSIPLLDVVLSILRRFLRNRPIFQADRGHIHHRLLDRGLSPKGAVLTMYGLCGLAAVLSLLVSALHNQFSGLIVILFGGAVWIGIRQLDYTEFASASRMLFGGRFRRIIDVETRLKDFEVKLAKAESVEECWAHVRTGSRDFGFHEVRMSLSGTLFEDFHCDAATVSSPRWQLRIPLPDSQYVNFYRGFDSEMNPLVISAFVEAVQRGLEARTAVLKMEVEVIRMPAGPERFYTAGASAGERQRAAL